MLEDTPASDGRRRYLIATGVTKDLPRTANQLTSSLGSFVGLFTDTFGYQRVTSLDLDPTAQELRAELRDFCETCKPEDIVTYYHTGHAELGPSGHRLRMGGEGNIYVTSLPTAEIAELMLEGTELRNALIILDTCFAGQGGAEALLSGLRTTGRSSGRTLAVVTAAHPTEQVRAGDFVRLFERAVAHPATGGHEPIYLPLAAIVGNIRENPQRPQWQTVSESVLFNTDEAQPFLPNPRYDARLHGLDLLTQLRIEQRQLRAEDMRSHFLPRARGSDAPNSDEWRFVGRHRALRDLAAWLRSEDSPRVCVVTGDPGSGKSAVIGRLVVLSDPERRSSVPLDGIPPDTVPELGSVNVAIHARGLTTGQVMTALSTAANVQAETAGQFLTAMRNRRLVAIIDAVDESVDPHDLVGRLLRPLTDSAGPQGLRLLLGSRRHFLDQLGPDASPIDLDSEMYADPTSVHSYAERCLRESRVDSPYASAAHTLTSAVASAVAEAAGRSFLVALIVSRTLASRNILADPGDPLWRASLPSTAADAMQQDLETRLGASAPKARDLLLPLAYAAGAGLPWEDIWAPLATVLSRQRYTDEDIVWLREQAGYYIVEALQAGGSVYRLYHAALAEYLRQERADTALNASIMSFLVAHLQRTCGTSKPEWPRAHAYTLAHLATHAARAQQLDALVLDPDFLLAADAAGLLAAFPSACGNDARLAATAYQRTLHNLDEAPDESRLSYLELSSHRCRADALLARITEDSASRPWTVNWMRWKAERPHRVLRADHDYPVLYVRCFSLAGHNPFILGVTAYSWHTWDPVTGQRLSDATVDFRIVGADTQVSVDGRVKLALITSYADLYVYDVFSGELNFKAPNAYSGPMPRLIERFRSNLASLPRICCASLQDGTAVAVTFHHSGIRRRRPMIRVWDLSSGEVRATWNMKELGAAPLSPKLTCLRLNDGPTVAFASHLRDESYVFDLDAGEELEIMDPDYGRGYRRARTSVFYIQELPTNYASDRDIYLRGSDGRRWLWVPPPDNSSFQKMPDRLATDESVPRIHLSGEILDVSLPGTKVSSSVFVGHLGQVTSADWLRLNDGQLLIGSASLDGTIRLWRVDDESDALPSMDELLYPVAGLFDATQSPGSHVFGALFARSGEGEDSRLQLWDFTAGYMRSEIRFSSPITALTCLQLSPSGPAVVTYDMDGFIRAWSVADGRSLFSYEADSESWARAISGASSGDGNSLLITAGHDGARAALWPEQDPGQPKWLVGHKGYVTSAYSGIYRGYAVAVTAGADARICIWKLPQGRLRTTFNLGNDWSFFPPMRHEIDAVELHSVNPSGRSIIIVNEMDGRLMLCNASNGRRLVTVGLRKPCVDFGCVPLGKNGLLLVTADADGRIEVWRVNSRDSQVRTRGYGIERIAEINVESRILGLWLSSECALILSTSNGLVSLQLNSAVLLAKQ